MARNTTEEPLVPLFEVAARLGTVEEVVRARLNGEVRSDWAGRPAVTIATARAIVERYERERAEQEEREAERLAAAKAAEAERRQRYERYLAEELQVEARRVVEELRDSNVTFLGVTPPLSPADRARAAERARERLEREG
jgi:hypothetical protein